MALTTSLTGLSYIKGDEKITVTSSDGNVIYYTLDGTTPQWETNGEPISPTQKYDTEKMIGAAPIDTSSSTPYGVNTDGNGMYTNYNPLEMVLNCKTVSETIPEIRKPFIYPVESNPSCLSVTTNGQTFDLVNHMGSEYKILYKIDGESTWNEWEGPRTVQVDENGVYVFLIEAKLQNIESPTKESMIKFFGYVVKP